MSEQSGIFKVVLYENTGISLTFVDETDISAISTGGQTVTLDCDNMLLNYISNQLVSENNKITYLHTITAKIYDLTIEILDEIEALNSLFGWIPVIFFRNDETKIIRTPIFLQDTDFDSKETHVFDIELIVQERTFNNLIDFSG